MRFKSSGSDGTLLSRTCMALVASVAAFRLPVCGGMDKRYQVFVSSTFADLKEERQAIVQALLGLDYFPSGMELFPAADRDQWTLIEGVINDSDYYLIVIGGRYGSTTPDGISYTEKEFDYAHSKGKPILAFVHSQPEAIPAGKTDQNDQLRERLEVFKKKVMTGRHVKMWANPMELQFVVAQAIMAETKRNPQEGWVRASNAADPTMLRALQGEIAALESQIRELSTTSPVGTDELKGGADEFVVRMQYVDEDGDTLYHMPKTDWDDIFRELGPILLHEQPETAMRQKLEKELAYYMDKDGNYPGDAARRIDIFSDDFDTIKVQLFALGLIRRGSAKRAIADKGVYWVLTAFGESHLMRLRALKKDQEDNRDMPGSGGEEAAD